MAKREGKQKTTKKKRVTIDLASAAAQEVDRLRAMTGLTSADLFRYGLVLARTYIDAQRRGMELRLVDPNKTDLVTRLELPVIAPRDA
jgi:hypothetical protein